MGEEGGTVGLKKWFAGILAVWRRSRFTLRPLERRTLRLAAAQQWGEESLDNTGHRSS
jgi:hypothetical protein